MTVMGEQRDFYNIKKEGFLFERQASVQDAVQDLEKHFTEARPGLRQLAEGLQDSFRAGTYDAIVGEDRSGRLPTLFVRRFAERVANDGGQKVRSLRTLCYRPRFGRTKTMCLLRRTKRRRGKNHHARATFVQNENSR